MWVEGYLIRPEATPGKPCLTPSPTPLSDSVRSFLKRSKLGRYNEEERAQQEAEAAQRLNEEKTQASAISVGSRCEVRAPGQPPRRGTVMYVGTWPTETLCPEMDSAGDPALKEIPVQ